MSTLTAFCDSFRDLATETITIRHKSSKNNYAENNYSGTATSYKAHIHRVTALNIGNGTNDYIVEYRAWIPTTTYAPQMDDEVVFPDGIIRRLVGIDVKYDEYGQQAVVLSIGRMRAGA